MTLRANDVRVLMFGWEFPPYHSGGLGVACLGIARSLVRRGSRIFFVLPRRFSGAEQDNDIELLFSTDARIEMMGVRSFLAPYGPSCAASVHRPDRGGELYGAGLFAEVARYAAAAADIASSRSFDVIHAHDWMSFPAAFAAQRVSGKPVVAHVHATEFDRTGGGSAHQAVYDIEHNGMAEADAVIAVSQYTKDCIVARYGIAPEKVRVVHNGVDAQDVRSAQQYSVSGSFDGPLVLFAGRLTLQKGPDYFIRAARRVAEVAPDVHFLLAGSGDMERGLIETVASWNLSHRIHFAGFVRPEELVGLYRTARVVVMPSVSEPFGIVPLEAASAGTPVILSKNAGVVEVLPNVLRVDFWDIEEIAHKILAVLSYRALGAHLTASARVDAAFASWDRAADGYLAVYAAVCAM